MRKLDLLAITACVWSASCPLAAQQLQLVPSQIFSVRAEGPSSISARRDLALQGIAFAVSPDTLLTAPLAIGAAADFRAEQQFSQGSVPARTITLRDQVGAAQPLDAQAQSTTRVAVLIRDIDAPPLKPLLLSACPVVDAEHLVHVTGTSGIAVRPVRNGQMVTHFRVTQQVADWNDALSLLGAPVHRDGRVVGILTDATADGMNLEVATIAEIADALPPDAKIECDPRVSLARLVGLESQLNALNGRVFGMDQRLNVQSNRTAAAEKTIAIVSRALFDVANDLADMQIALDEDKDIQPILNRMSERLKSNTPLLTTVSTIESFLQSPTWRGKAKIDSGKLSLTFSYRSQMPGPQFSDELKLCVRIIKPYRATEDAHHNFRAAEFYANALKQDATKLVLCDWSPVANPGSVKNEGQYIFETYRGDLKYMFDAYRESKDWIPADYKWNGLAYAVLIKPGREGTGGEEDTVILKGLILVPDDPAGAASQPVECILFETDQNLIDFLANRAGPIANASFDDVSNPILDPENASDECVLSSVE